MPGVATMSMSNDLTRRDVLRTGAGVSAVAALGGLAGCSDFTGGGGGGGSESGVQGIPADAGAAAVIDAEAVRTDDATAALVNTFLDVQAEREYYDGPENYEAVLDEFENDTGLAPDGVSTLTPFLGWGGEYSPVDGEFAAARFEADWSTDDVVASLEENGGSYSDEAYADGTLYTPDEDYRSFLGVLGDGRYVVGTETAVTDTLDVEVGEKDAMPETLQSAYAETRTAPVRFVSGVPEDEVPESAGGQFDTSVFRNVESVAGSVYADGDTRGIETTLAAGSESDAEDIADIIDGGLTVVEQEAPEAVATELDAVEVTQDGTSVTVSYGATVDELTDLIDETASQSGASGGDASDRVPQVAFGFDYDRDAKTVTVTHDGGDHVRQSALIVRGSGFADAADAEMTGPGVWQGTAGGESSGDPAVAAGDRVTVGAEPDCEIRLVWRSEDRNTAATLAEFTGPDA